MAIGILLMSLLILAAQCPDTNSRPVALFSADPTSGVSPLTVDFDASASYDPDGTVVAYSWDFGDGTFGTDVTTNHTFTTTTDKTYTVRLTVTDDGGRSATTSATISVTGSGGTLFFDDFEDGSDPAWAPTPGWTTWGGRYYLKDMEHKWGYSYIVTGKDWRDYIVEADIDVGYGSSGAGLVLRAQEDLNNMVIVRGRYGEIRWSVVVNGETAVTSNPITPGFFAESQHVRVEVSGSTYKLFIEGLLRSTFTDSRFSNGMPGVTSFDIYGYPDLSPSFDNFKVTAQ